MSSSVFVISPKFHFQLEDLKSVLTGLAIMVAGTIVTALIDTLLEWLTGLDLTSITIYGFPILTVIAPFMAAILNSIRKAVTSTKYIK